MKWLKFRFDVNILARFSSIEKKSGDTHALAMFVRCVLAYVDEGEEMLVLAAAKETSQSSDVENVLDTVLTRFSVPLNKLLSVATDEAPVMYRPCRTLEKRSKPLELLLKYYFMNLKPGLMMYR
jgi:hypothetical protein